MRTLITKELAVIDNQLRATGRHRVHLLGDRLSFEIEIKQYKKEPRCFCQCTECVFASTVIFEPKDCDDIKNMRSIGVRCTRGNDTLSETLCLSFSSADR